MRIVAALARLVKHLLPRAAAGEPRPIPAAGRSAAGWPAAHRTGTGSYLAAVQP